MWRPSLGPRNRYFKTFSAALYCAVLLTFPAVQAQTPAASTDLNAAQKAVRMHQFEQAFALFRQAADAGSAEAQYQLGNLYLQGRGTQKSADKAQYWFEQAAQQSHPGAQYGLAQALLAEDPEQARSLLTAAAAQGYRSAKIQLERLAPSTKANKQAPYEAQWFGAARNNNTDLMQRLFDEHHEVDTTDEAERTALFHAIEADSAKAVDWLIKRGANVNHQDKFGLTPIQTTIERNQTDLLQTLLKSGANKSLILSNGDNLLQYALRRKHYQQAKIMIQQGVDVNHRNKEGWTPLDLAEYQGAEASAALLVKHGAQNGNGWRSERRAQDLDAVAEQLNEGTLPPVARAIINDNQPLADRLLNSSPELVNTPLENGTTLLVLAVKHNKPKMISTLLKHKVNVNQVAYRGVNAVQVAAQRGDTATVKTLLAAGANPVHADDQGRDALISAIEESKSETASVLIRNILGEDSGSKAVKAHLKEIGAPVDRYILLATQHHADEALDALLPYATATAATDEQQRTALWFAAAEGNSKLIPKLLKAGIPADMADSHGRTPFIMAANSGCLECARQLLSASKINHQSKSGNTALMTAAANGDTLLTSWLIQNTADIEVRNQRGDTALMIAVNANAMDVVRRLLQANASVTRKNKLGFSSIDLAKEVSPQMLELVKSKSVLGIF